MIKQILPILIVFFIPFSLLSQDNPALLTFPIQIINEPDAQRPVNPGMTLNVNIRIKTRAGNEILLYSEYHENLVVGFNNLILVPIGKGSAGTGTYEGLKEDLQIYDILIYCFAVDDGMETIISGEFEVTPYSSAYRASYSENAGNAETAGLSNESEHALVADYANTAGIAEQATTAESAMTATHAGLADFSMIAGLLEYQGVVNTEELNNPNTGFSMIINGKNYTFPALEYKSFSQRWGNYNPVDNSTGLGGLNFNDLDNLFNNGPLVIPALPLKDPDQVKDPLYFKLPSFMRKNQSFDANDNLLDVVQFTFGPGNPTPHVYGCEIPDKIHSTNTLFFNNTYGFESAMDIILDETEPSDNSYSAISVTSSAPFGLASLGNSYGLFGTGQLGGLLASPAQGADVSTGLYATIGYTLPESQISYMVYADGQGQDNAYAGYFNGCTIFDREPTILSDSRLKINIREFESVLENINKLNPVSYNYKTSINENHNGFLADEVEKIFPELVRDVKVPTETSFGEHPKIEKVEPYKSMRYNGMIPILTKGIQELTKKLELKEKEIEEQNVLINDLIKRVEALENKK